MADPEEFQWRLRERAEILAAVLAPDSPYRRTQTRLSFLVIVYEGLGASRPPSTIDGLISAAGNMPLPACSAPTWRSGSAPRTASRSRSWRVGGKKAGPPTLTRLFTRFPARRLRH